LKRRVNLMKTLGTSALPAEEFSQLTSTINEMIGIYNRATVCPFDNQGCAEDDPSRLPLEVSNQLID